MKRAAIYARVSTEDQTDNTSFDTQVTDCRREAERRGYLTTEADVYLEDVSGAYGIDRRPVLRTVWEKYQTGFYDAIIVWHTDRLSRSRVRYHV
ncbi:recombinase family protein [Hydrogenibacillus schlegelii]|uniref:recombinase family protein n=1 Tax=Hydrogenibacillus schlegelii TaxID=1484 RepID=UPI00349FE406